jgi:hypothetical protein
MSIITSNQLTELGDRFLEFGQAVGNYRIENRRILSDNQNDQIKLFHIQLLNYADDLYTTSATLIINDVGNSLDTIKDVTTEIYQTYNQLRNVQKAINVAAAGITLASAIFTKNPENISSAIVHLKDAWNADDQE